MLRESLGFVGRDAAGFVRGDGADPDPEAVIEVVEAVAEAICEALTCVFR